jgi:hypothetical protein
MELSVCVEMLFPLLQVCVALVERLNPELSDPEDLSRW